MAEKEAVVPKYPAVDFILSIFDKDPGKAQLKFEEFVLDNLKDNSSPLDKSKGIILGSQEFIQKMKNILKNNKKIREIKKTERFANRPDLSEIFADVKDKRNQKIGRAHV